MNYLGATISLLFVFVVAILLLRKQNPYAVLLLAGLLMLIIADVFNFNLPTLKQTTGYIGFDILSQIKDSFVKIIPGMGLMIMSIGGFVAYIDKTGASQALVHLTMKPLNLLKNKPYLAASLVIPIGQFLFIAIPSAAGLGLLLMASLFPILINLGVSRISAVSVITASTAFDIGPASSITASISTLCNIDVANYFLNYQIPLVLPLSFSMMITYYFVNKYFDKKNTKENTKIITEFDNKKTTIPIVFAIIPLLPVILLVLFSRVFTFFSPPIVLDTTTAMFVSLFISLIFQLIRTKNTRQVIDSLQAFWSGMASIFKTVVVLIVTADIFAKGLISLGLIDSFLAISNTIGLEAIGVGIFMALLIFLASMLMGSGNASFFSFAPLVPKIAKSLHIDSLPIILPMQLAASIGRTVSPVSGILIATSQIANIPTIEVVKRNLIPLIITLGIMLIYHNF